MGLPETEKTTWAIPEPQPVVIPVPIEPEREPVTAPARREREVDPELVPA